MFEIFLAFVLLFVFLGVLFYLSRKAGREAMKSKSCKICDKPVYDGVGAVVSKNSGQRTHFNCLIESLKLPENQ